MARSIILFSMMIMFLFGCTGGNENTANTLVEEKEGEVKVEIDELELMVDVNVLRNQAEFIITLINNSSETKKLDFSSSQKYEIIVTEQNNQEVYRYSEGKMFAQALESTLIKPAESIKWEEIWEGIKPGEYEVEVSILSQDTEGLIKKKTIHVTEEGS
ncbi:MULTISPECIES: BsuPI-related putative proteinase inhibitor [Metabacillus]|jgi:hypothetical protein|uniref:Intracellular proteinase inhibitor BsuPI domain-containing protein n=3 Tax=Metabacillus TaxID=2675233 RepID=A0A179SUB2_9BACI|nr:MULTISPECIES: BsuPI-related putative proteinase inhibitor [Metabacillus]OAS83893.1 hypothetical protein A6K24_07225 [Metabacillus litoralis]QNF28394.1 hypothetical protein HUW50_13465 [Metabacillus sp. KUDC1714]